MLDALSVASAMQEYPENVESLRPSIETCIVALAEAADLVAHLTAAKGLTAAPQQAALRIESQARLELSETLEPNSLGSDP